MKQYHDLLKHILENGDHRMERTGTGASSIFGYQMRFDLSEGFPIVTTKRVWFKGVKAELEWMMSGSTNVYDLPENVQKWWLPWADKNGDLGPTYGEQYGAHLDRVISGIKINPTSRRHVMNLWDSYTAHSCNLPPCHGTVIQFFVSSDMRLSCHTYQRSADAFIGLPVNIAAYALLTRIVADKTGYDVGDLVYSLGDAHIYDNHIEQVELQLTREHFALPQLDADYNLINYQHHPAIKAEVAV